MLQVLRELGYNLRKHTLNSLLLVAQFTLCLWLLAQVSGYYINLSNTPMIRAALDNKSYYALTLTGAESSVTRSIEVSNDAASAPSVRQALAEIRSLPIDYIAFMYTGLTISRQEFTEQLGGNDPKPFLENMPGVDIGDSQSETLSLATTQMDRAAIEQFHLDVSEGRMFSAADFEMESYQQSFPILLGAEYAPYYDVGDTMQLNILLDGKIYHSAQIIGFLKPGCQVFSDNMGAPENPMGNLDYQIILPYFDSLPLTEDQDEQLYAMKNYCDQLLGVIVVPGSNNTAQAEESLKQINEICMRHNLFTMGIKGGSDGAYLFQSETRQSVNVMMALTMIVTAFSLFSLCFMLINTIDSNLKRYAIQMLNGRTRRSITATFLLETGLTLLISTALVLPLSNWIFVLQPRYLLFIAAAALLFMLIGSTVILCKLGRLNLEQLMRRQES